jgi:hypothetical protein
LPSVRLPLSPPQRLEIAPQAFLALSSAALPMLALRALSLNSLALDPGAALALLALAFGAFPLQLLRQ